MWPPQDELLHSAVPHMPHGWSGMHMPKPIRASSQHLGPDLLLQGFSEPQQN